MFRFANPEYLYLLLLLPAVWILYFYARWRNRRNMARMGRADVLQELMPDVSHYKPGLKFFLRDAENILQADAIVLIGTGAQTQGLNCAHCGYATCAAKPEAVPCAINSVDVGIAIGSACAMASDMRVDTRVMFSAGLAAQRLHFLGEKAKCVMAIPVSASSKNPFFDRKPHEAK